MHFSRNAPLRTLLLAGAVLAFSAPAQADTNAPEHFSRGVSLFNDGSLEAALVEFQEAYDLSHNFRILFNIALCHATANDPGAAIRAYERYLSEGGSGVPERAQVATDEILRLRKAVEEVTITSDAPAGATLWIDGKRAGELQSLAPQLVKLGRRELRVAAGGRSIVVEELIVAGRRAVHVKFPPPMPVAPLPAPPHVPVSTRISPPWALWATTVGLAGGAATCGVFALSERRAALRSAATFGAPTDDARGAQSRAVRWAIGADVLGVAALGTLAVATYLTYTRGRIHVAIGPSSATLGGTF